MENKMIDLMTPRYEVIAPVPFSKFMVGDILHQHRHKVFGVDYTWFSADRYSQCINAKEIFDYPHLFRPLAWHEKRDIKNMPEYVKCENAKGMYFAGKVMEWDFNNRLAIFSKYDNGKPKEVISFNRETKDFTPATSTEYDNYIKQKI